MWVGGRDPFDITADPNFGPIQLILILILNERNGPKIFEEKKLKNCWTFMVCSRRYLVCKHRRKYA